MLSHQCHNRPAVPPLSPLSSAQMVAEGKWVHSHSLGSDLGLHPRVHLRPAAQTHLSSTLGSSRAVGLSRIVIGAGHWLGAAGEPGMQGHRHLCAVCPPASTVSLASLEPPTVRGWHQPQEPRSSMPTSAVLTAWCHTSEERYCYWDWRGNTRAAEGMNKDAG